MNVTTHPFLNSDYVVMNEAMEKVHREQLFLMRHPFLQRLYQLYLGAYSNVVSKLICDRIGHDLDDDGSYANPDSGGEGWYCLRCGKSWWIQYY